MSLYSSLSISRQGLAVSQLGLQLTAQNIANVNSPGYKRQRMEQSDSPYGLGVFSGGVDRVLNTLAERRLVDVTTEAAMSERTAQAYVELESLFNELDQSGLDAELQDFNQALQDLSARPSGEFERAALRSHGTSMGHMFGFLSAQMADQANLQNEEIDNAVERVNEIVRNIAGLNRSIREIAGNELGINEMLNDRDEWVRQLAEILPVHVSEDDRGAFTLYIEASMPLVIGSEYSQLESRPDTTDDLNREVIWKSSTGSEIDITESVTSGTMGAALAIRDRVVPEMAEKIDRLAAEFVLTFNRQHREGTGLDGATGHNFFAELPVDVRSGKGSSGDIVIGSAVVADDAQLTLDAYEIRFTSPTTYEVVNATTGAAVSASPTGGSFVSGQAIEFAGMSIVLSGTPGEGDAIEVSMARGAAGKVRISDELEASLDAIAAGLSDSPGDNRNILALTAVGSTSTGSEMSFSQLYNSYIVRLGVDASSASQESDTQETLLNQIGNLVESVSGVNIDEETTSLLAFQRAFQASSKVIQTVDEMLATIIQML